MFQPDERSHSTSDVGHNLNIGSHTYIDVIPYMVSSSLGWEVANY